MSEFPEVGGTIGMFRDAILSISKSDQKDMALGCALAIGGVLTANRFSLNGQAVYTPMYVMNVGGTSSGKDAGIRLIDALFSPAGLGSNRHFRLLGLSNYSSDVAMISNLAEQRTRIDYFQEFGEVFKGLAMKGDRKSAVGDCLKKLFSAKQYFNGHYTKTAGKFEGRCAYPSVSLFGTIQQTTLIENATAEILHDGLLSRFLYFSENVEAAYLGNQRRAGISETVLQHIANSCFEAYPENPLLDQDIAGGFLEDKSMCDFRRQVLTISPELDSFIEEIDRAHHAEMVKLKTNEMEAEAAAYGKVIENAEKLMKVICVALGSRTITREHFDLAFKIAETSYKKSRDMLLLAGSSEGSRHGMKLLAYIKKAPKGQAKRSKAMKDCHLNAKQMKEAVEYLVGRGELEETTPGQPGPNGRAIVYLCLPTL